MLSLQRLALLGLALACVSGYDTANCTRRTLCNGIMCSSQCVPGTVEVDAWVSAALAFQRELQRDEPLARATLPGTHNSAIAQAYGFGIEMDYIAKLLNTTYYGGDDLGEGVCQTFSVLDQLRLGLRHIEIDINSGYFKGLSHREEIYVCHSPGPLDPGLVAQVDLAAKKQHIAGFNWAPKNLSCMGTNVPFAEMLSDVKGWLDAPGNEDEVVVLYLDVKPGCVVLPAQTSAAFAVMRGVFGDSIWGVADGDPRAHSRAQMLARGKRVVFEDHADMWNKPKNKSEALLVFTPDLWSHQFSAGALEKYPNCSIEGEAFSSWYTPVAARGNTSLAKPYVRGLGWGRTSMGDDVAGAMRCGVNILSPNYYQPADSEGYVWSVARGSWPPKANEGAAGAASPAVYCMAMLPSGAWAAVGGQSECREREPVACRAKGDDTVWQLASSPSPSSSLWA